MGYISTELLLIVLCSLVVISYLLSILSKIIKVPSVLLLLFAGILFRFISVSKDYFIPIPPTIVEALGVVGLLMIILEAGLDLKVEKEKLGMIRNSFFSALTILIFSTAFITAILYFWLHEDIVKCIVYALPLSIMSSSIVIPSIHHLTQEKKEFLIYEASFSDILGVLFFNYLTSDEFFTGRSIISFGSNIIIAIFLSLVLSVGLFFIMTKTKMNIKFFLIFSLLILIYAGGKLIHLPSLLIILVFGLLISNWEKIKVPWLKRHFPQHEVAPVTSFLHSITAESSFLVRTFFFILFGYTINLQFLQQQDVWIIGGLIVVSLFVVRFLYLRFFLHTNIFPETFFIPRGLITIVLFYKIPIGQKLTNFNDDILFFVILSTSIILSLGMVFTKTPGSAVIEEPQFTDSKEIV